MAFLNVLFAVGFVCFAAFLQYAFVCAQTHGASHVGDGLLLFHDVDDVMGRLFVHFARIGVGVSQHVAGKLDGHALHAQADAEGGDIVSAGVFDSYEFTGDASFSETRSDEYAGLAFQCFGYVVFGQLFAVDKVNFYFAVIVCPGL